MNTAETQAVLRSAAHSGNSNSLSQSSPAYSRTVSRTGKTTGTANLRQQHDSTQHPAARYYDEQSLRLELKLRQEIWSLIDRIEHLRLAGHSGSAEIIATYEAMIRIRMTRRKDLSRRQSASEKNPTNTP